MASVTIGGASSASGGCGYGGCRHSLSARAHSSASKVAVDTRDTCARAYEAIELALKCCALASAAVMNIISPFKNFCARVRRRVAIFVPQHATAAAGERALTAVDRRRRR